MNTLDVIARLQQMLDDAIELVVDQQHVLQAHGIEDYYPHADNSMLARRERLLQEQKELMDDGD